MHDGGKIVLGLVLFVGAVTFPAWYSAARGGSKEPPRLALPGAEKRCVESREHMRSQHMVLLNDWRDSVVRDGNGTYVSQTYGTKHPMKLTSGCLGCHGDRAQFCDRCHGYLGVAPYCWDCHLDRTGTR